MADDESTDPSSVELQPFVYQVGGHKGIQVTGDGTLIVKAALGTLRLEGQNTAEGLARVEGIPENEKELAVIENVAHGFRKPNILDIKLGTTLYDEDAPPAKKERMVNKARCTTSGEVGIRLTGFQVFGNKASQPLIFPNGYGKSICTAELPAGIARFFPVHGSMIGLPGTHPGGPMDVGLPGTLITPILSFIRNSVQELRDELSTVELRLIGSSLLIVYEGDWDRAEMGVQWLANQLARDEDEQKEGEEEWEEGDEESDEGESESPCVVRLIDFAHTRLKPGQGPDQGVLKGLDTLLGLLDGRIASIS